MPLYEYKCNKCGHEMTAFKSIAERNNITENCIECNLVGTFDMVISTPMIVSGVSSQLRRPDWFKDKMKEVKKHVGPHGSPQFESNVL